MSEVEEDAVLLTLKKELAEIFTRQKLKIIEIIRDKNPSSIGELSKILKRDIAAVYRDLRVLEKYEILSLEKTGRSVRPILTKSLLVIPIVESSSEQDKPEISGNMDNMGYIG